MQPHRLDLVQMLRLTIMPHTHTKSIRKVYLLVDEVSWGEQGSLPSRSKIGLKSREEDWLEFFCN